MSPTGLKHDNIRSRLGYALEGFVEAHDLGVVVVGDTGFELSEPEGPDTVRAADIAFIGKERLPAEDDPAWDGYPTMAPDMAVEIVSPSQYRPEVTEKVKAWLAAGVRLVWVVWPKLKTVEVWRPGSDTPVAILAITDMLDGLDVLPGFTYPVAQFFSTQRQRRTDGEAD